MMKISKVIQNLQYGRFCQNPPLSSHLIYPPPLGRPLSANMNLFTQLMGYGSRLVPVAPPQSASNRPAGGYQQYIDEVPRYRGGTVTYLPNHKVSQGTGIQQVQERGIIATTRVTAMVRGKGTGMSIQRHELLDAATIVTKLRNRARGQTGWQQVRVEWSGLEVHRDMTGFFVTVWITTVIFKSNDILRKQTALKGERKNYILFMIFIGFMFHYWWFRSDDIFHLLVMIPPSTVPPFWLVIFIILVNDTMVRQAAMAIKCLLLIYYKNGRGHNFCWQAFFSCVILRLAQSRHGASYQQ